MTRKSAAFDALERRTDRRHGVSFHPRPDRHRGLELGRRPVLEERDEALRRLEQSRDAVIVGRSRRSAAGVIVFGGAFSSTCTSRLIYWLTLVIAILWVLEIVVSFFAQGLFEPDFIIWLNRLSADVIILAALG